MAPGGVELCEVCAYRRARHLADRLYRSGVPHADDQAWEAVIGAGAWPLRILQPGGHKAQLPPVIRARKMLERWVAEVAPIRYEIVSGSEFLTLEKMDALMDLVLKKERAE